jgi:hypothetical protein
MPLTGKPGESMRGWDRSDEVLETAPIGRDLQPAEGLNELRAGSPSPQFLPYSISATSSA